MVGEESDESGNVKIKEKWFRKQIEKKMKLMVKKMKQRLNKEGGENTMKKIKEVF